MSVVDFLSGLTVHRVCIGYDLRLLVGDEKWQNDAVVVIEEPCVVTHPDGSERKVQISAPETIPALLAADPRLIVEVSEEGGALRIVLDDGCEIVIPPNDEYEAWRIEGPGDRGVVCMPGGELAVWSE